MGANASLCIEQLEIDWGKNHHFNNHSRLFLPTDIKDVPYYFDDNENRYHYYPAFVRKLGQLKKRLELLGYSITNIKYMYEEEAASFPDYLARPLPFDVFAEVITSANIPIIKSYEEEYAEFDQGEFVKFCIFKDPEFNKTASLDSMDEDLFGFYEYLDPYILLRLILENSENHDLELQWKYNEIFESGYISEEDLYQQITDEERYLIVTEGSSDSQIIRIAIDLLEPEIADFFYFIDMKDNYPFTGVGSLLNFCKGLAKIRIENHIVAIFDNDTAGREMYEQALKIKIPKKLKIMKLPDINSCRKILCKGPSGENIEDINGKAVAIECFLDFNYKMDAPPIIRWKNYNERLDSYHGSLIDKAKYQRIYFDMHRKDKTYDFSKMEQLLTSIYEHCVG